MNATTLKFFGPCGTEAKRSEAMNEAHYEAKRLTKDTGREHVIRWNDHRSGYDVVPGRADISAPFQARFSPDGANEMFAHNLPEMFCHMARIMQAEDKRFRGFMRVTTLFRSRPDGLLSLR
jgi:hypothetical protein